MIGSNSEAKDKAGCLRLAGARLRVVSEKKFHLSLLKNQFFVIFCPKDNPAMTKAIAAVCRRRRILLCAIDQPTYCDVVNVSTFDKGLLRIMAATHGVAPAISKKIRLGLEQSLKNVPVDRYLNTLADLRKRLKKEIKDPSERIKKLIEATDGFEFKVAVKLPKKWRKR